MDLTHPASPITMKSGSRLELVLRAGRFAITAELNPPDSADPEETFRRALVLSQVCDAINATDASGANCHMSSMGICALLTRLSERLDHFLFNLTIEIGTMFFRCGGKLLGLDLLV